MHRILITGANGFVGRALCLELARRGYLVRGAVRKLSHSAVLSCETTIVGDIGGKTDWEDSLTEVDAIVHLAARVHVMRDMVADPLSEFCKVNVAGTERLARMAGGVKRFVFVSSIKVNGECTSYPYIPKRGPTCRSSYFTSPGFSKSSKDTEQWKEVFSESDLPDPQDPYAVSKEKAEAILHRISQETGMNVVIIRPPLIYGPEVGANFLKLLRFVKNGIPLPLASIQNKRSLVYLGNLVDAIITCLEHPAAGGKTYFVSDGEDVSTPELIRRIATALRRSARLVSINPDLLRLAGYLTGRPAEVHRLLHSLVIDSSKIRQELDWTPPYSMNQGLEETAKWYNSL